MVYLNGQIREAVTGISDPDFTDFWSTFESNFRNHLRQFLGAFAGVGGKPVDKFIIYVHEAMRSVQSDAREASERIRELDKAKLISDVNDLIVDIVEAVEMSPVSCLLSWSDVTIDGQTLSSSLVDVLARLMTSDFAPALDDPLHKIRLYQTSHALESASNLEER